MGTYFIFMGLEGYCEKCLLHEVILRFMQYLILSEVVFREIKQALSRKALVTGVLASSELELGEHVILDIQAF